MTNTKKPATVSIVIPVYNEQNHLGACLTAIARQTVKPFEVIVVDNNSSDGTVALAKQFPFVRVLHERRQGVVHARNRGFDVARGEFIGRIDADTLLPVDWVATLEEIFADPTIDALSGSVTYYEMALSQVLDYVDAAFRRHVARALGDDVFLYGANMALRRSAWRAVRPAVCLRSGIHEDFDLAIHMVSLGLRVTYEEQLGAAISSRRADASFVEFWRYTQVSPHTYAEHNIKARWHMYPVVALAVLGYVPLRISRKGYDPATSTFSVARLLTTAKTMRVDPTTNVV